MAVEPRHEVRPLSERLHGYFLAVLLLAAWLFIGHRWLSEPWSAGMVTMLVILVANVLYSEIRAWRIRRMPG